MSFIIWLCVGWCLACLFFGLFVAQSYNAYWLTRQHYGLKSDKEAWQRSANDSRGDYEMCKKMLDSERLKAHAAGTTPTTKESK